MRLVINPGSTSKKYALFEGEKNLAIFRFEQAQKKFRAQIKLSGATETSESVTKTVYNNGLTFVVDYLKKAGVISEESDITHIALRVVAPGTYFLSHRFITNEYIKKLKKEENSAPLHIPATLSEIKYARKLLPDVVLVGVSDSVYHKTIPDTASLYSIPKTDTEKYDIRRFGYHGHSVHSVIRQVGKMDNCSFPQKAIVCHVGGGASVTAVRDGRSIETSMGFSPLSGLHMSTRSGDIDPDAVLALLEKKRMDTKKLRAYLYSKSGLKAVGNDNDMRVLLEKYGTDDARFAIDMYVWRLKKYIGAYYAVLGGLDMLVLTGAVNERNAFFREIAYSNLKHLGIYVDETRNTMKKLPFFIETGDAPVKILVIETDEMGEMNRVIDEATT